jgi:hypothetical protein
MCDTPNDRLNRRRTARPSINKAEEKRSKSSDLIQLERFEVLIGGTSWVPETPDERAPSREFCLPPSAAPAPTKAPRSAPSGRPVRTPDEGERGNP